MSLNDKHDILSVVTTPRLQMEKLRFISHINRGTRKKKKNISFSLKDGNLSGSGVFSSS